MKKFRLSSLTKQVMCSAQMLAINRVSRQSLISFSIEVN